MGYFFLRCDSILKRKLLFPGFDMFVRVLLFSVCLVGLIFALGCDSGPAVATAADGATPQDEAKTPGNPPAGNLEKPQTQTQRPVLQGPETSTRASTNIADQMKREAEAFEEQSITIPSSWKRLSETNHIWADTKTKSVIVRGSICLREGLLEMFACPTETKDHESIVSTHALSSEAHAAFLAMGVNPGKPMVWVGKYIPVTGPILEIEVWWSEEGKLQKRRAQEMIRNVDTDKPMQSEFVFGGSEIYQDRHSKENLYYGDSGEFINVTNSPYAMIDIAIASTDDAEQGLLYGTLTEKIPPMNTKVYVVMTPTGKIRKNDPEATKESPQPSEPQESKPSQDGSSS